MKEHDTSSVITISGILGGGFFAAGVYLMLSSYPEQDVVGMMGGLGLVVVGGRWLAPLLAGAIAEPAGRIFYPGDKLDKPQPIYSLAQAHRSFQRYEEAVQELLKLVEAHPQEFQAWRELLELTLLELKDESRAREYHLRALRSFQDPAQRQRLHMAWSDLSARAMRAQEKSAADSNRYELPDPDRS